jgi:LmeA-like phospholipid-binding
VTEPTVPLPYDWDQSKKAAAPVRSRRRVRRRTKWLIALLVLLGLLVAADRVALVVAEDQLASRIQSSQHLSQKPDVSIDGFPFLTQVVSRDFPHATVDIHGLTANNGLVISDLHADLHGVHVSSGFNSATVDTLDATAQMSYADIAKALGSELTVEGVQVGTVKLSYAGNDQLTAAYSVLGVGVSATVDVSVTGDNTLNFKSVSIKTPVSALFTPPNFNENYELGALPFGMQLKNLTFTPSAVDISATGTNVNLSQTADSKG